MGSRTTELALIDAVVSTDLVMVVDDPGGTPVNKKATQTQLLAPAAKLNASNLFVGDQTIKGILDVRHASLPTIRARMFQGGYYGSLTLATNLMTDGVDIISDDPAEEGFWYQQLPWNAAWYHSPVSSPVSASPRALNVLMQIEAVGLFVNTPLNVYASTGQTAPALATWLPDGVTKAFWVDPDGTIHAPTALVLTAGSTQYTIGTRDPSGAISMTRSGGSPYPVALFGFTDGIIKIAGVHQDTADVAIGIASIGGKVFITPSEGGGWGKVQIGRRVSDGAAGVGAATELWPATGQTDPVLAAMVPGGATKTFWVDANGTLHAPTGISSDTPIPFHHTTHQPGGTDVPQLAGQRLYGRQPGAAGPMQEIDLGTGLVMSGPTLAVNTDLSLTTLVASDSVRAARVSIGASFVASTTLFVLDQNVTQGEWGTSGTVVLKASTRGGGSADNNTWTAIENDGPTSGLNAGIAFVNTNVTSNYGRIDIGVRGTAGWVPQALSVGDGGVTIDGDLVVSGTITPSRRAEQMLKVNALVGNATGSRTLLSQSLVSGLSLRHDQAAGVAHITVGNYDTQTYQPLLLEAESVQFWTGLSPTLAEHVRVHPSGGVTVGTDHSVDPGVGVLVAAGGLGSTPVTVAASAGSRLFGRGAGAAGPMQEITLGAGLLMTGTVLSATAVVSGNVAYTDQANTFTQSQLFNGRMVVTGGSGTAYSGAPIEVQAVTSRIAFHWPGVVASQIGVATDGTIRTYDNPGTGYAPFQAATIQANTNQWISNIHTTGYMYPSAVTNPGVIQTSWYLGSHSSYGLYTNTGLYVAGNIWTPGTVYATLGIRPRVYSVGDTTSITPHCDQYDMYMVGNITSSIQILNGYCNIDGWPMTLRLRDNGAVRPIYWDTLYQTACGVSLPTQTMGSGGRTGARAMHIGFRWSAHYGMWMMVALAVEP